MTDTVLQGADKRISSTERSEKPRVSGIPTFTVESVTTHLNGNGTITLRCSWIAQRGHMLIDGDETIELPAIGDFADCKPGDVFRLVRTGT